ncbi:MAG: right-handed parallel beta-helix repeat-containing protein [Bacteroidota bacterium]
MSRLIWLIPLAVLLCAPSLRVQASPEPVVLYVHPNRAGDGSSWAQALPSVQAALAVAPRGAEVWVAAGTYRPSADTVRTATFRLRDHVALYGGFIGTEVDRRARNPALHRTILSGDLGQTGVADDNAYHVVTGSGTGPEAVLDGFVITGGYADGAFPHNRGAGVFNASGSPTLRNLVIRDNQAFAVEARAGFGAGVYNDAGSSPVVADTRLEGNRVVDSGGGGGMANKNGSAPQLTRVVFEGNEAATLGGGMTNDTGSSPVLRHVVFRANRARFSGGLDNYGNADPVLYNVHFEDNEAAVYGGGLTNDAHSDPLLVHVTFSGNVAHNEEQRGGGALHNDASSPILLHVTFFGNKAADGASGIHSVGTSFPQVSNGIFWNEGPEIEGPAQVRHALVRGGYAAGDHVLSAEPLFTDAPRDLRPQARSPVCEAGAAEALPPDRHDLDGDGDYAEPLPLTADARPETPSVDLGAYACSATQ